MRHIPILLALMFAAPNWALAQVPVVPPNQLPADGLPPPTEQEGVETLTRGPIHEAFANPADPDPEPSPVVVKQPPQDVPEQPPEYQPEGGDYEWISGYWEWDDDRDEFLWVTGVWRQAPPDMRWLPGYWNEVQGGWQRVKGFWVAEENDNVTYYAQQPPATLEAGPSSPAPADNYFWIPGCWNYVDTGYAWQGGYWAPYEPNWVWVPSRWCWTPAGYVFLPGHWDHRLASRGQIFAPVYFSSTVYANPGWYYRPSVVIPTDNLFIHLWVRPRNNCYYFGNYYGSQYAGLGFVPWANLHTHHRHRHYHDPFYSYCRVHYRQQGVDFVGRVQGWHKYYDEHPEHRSARNWREQQEWQASRRGSGPTANTQLVAHRVEEIARRTDSPVKVSKIDASTREQIAKRAGQVRELDNERRKLEREQAQVNARVTPLSERDRDNDRGRDKAGSLVDRVENSGRTDKGADKGDRLEKGDRVDRGDKGEKGEKGRPGGDAVVRTSPTAKLSLPKTDTPRPKSNVTRAPDGDRGKSDRQGKAPPLPTASRRPVAVDDRGPTTRGNQLPDAGRSSDRTPFGAKTGEPARGPDRIDEPKAPRVDTGRTQKADQPAKTGKSTVRSSTDPTPGPTIRRGNDTPPRVEQPRNIDTPKVTTPRASDVPRVQPPTKSSDIPRVQPPRPSNESPRINSPGKSNDPPRIQNPNRGNDPPRGNNDSPPRGNSGQRNTPPTTSPRISSPPPNVETPRSAPRVDQPSNRNSAPRGDQPSSRSSPPRNDNPGASSRSSGRDKSPSSNSNNSNNSNNNKGKGKKGDDN